MARSPTRLAFYADYYADPVWLEDGSMLALEALPISPELLRDLRSWTSKWTRSAMAEIGGRPLPEDEEAAEHARGVALCARLRVELGDAYEVVSGDFG